MQSTTFKRLLSEVCLKNSFQKDGNHFRRYEDDIICAIGLQKSNYTNAYYLNLSYIIRILHPELEKPKYSEGDIRTRFSFYAGDKKTDLFDLEIIQEVDQSEITSCFMKNFEDYINSYLSIDGLKQLLLKRPAMLFQTTLSAKKILGYTD